MHQAGPQHSKSSVKSPKILSANTRSVLNKLDEVHSTISSQKVDIFAACETWLHGNIHDNLVRLPNYRHYRDDRHSRVGGGVCIWVHNSQSALQLLPEGQPDQMESVWLCLPFNQILLTCLYIPPIFATTAKNEIDNFIIRNFDIFLNRYPDFDVVICGDLNRYTITDLEDSLDVVNLVTETTRGSAILDFFLISTTRSSDYVVSVTAPFGRSDHNGVFAEPIHPSYTTTKVTKLLYDLRNSNIENFLSLLSRVNWSPLYLSIKSVDDKCDFFHETLSKIMQQTIPTTCVEMSETDKPWVTPFVKHCIQKRWDAFRKKDFEEYRYWKRKCHNVISTAKHKWSLQAQNSARDLWRTVNTTIGSKSRSSLFPVISKYSSTGEAAEAINKKFETFFNPTNDDTNILIQQTASHSAWQCEIEPALVWHLLECINTRKAMGSDMMPATLYKRASIFLAEPLAHIFSISLRECTFPDRWKHAHICPLPKSASVDIDALRPIALLPLPSKIFERIVLNSFRKQFIAEFGPEQFGSRPGSSTTCAVVRLMHHSLSLLEASTVSGIQIVAYDYSKAFDTLGHSIIMRSLVNSNLPSEFVKWTQSYLTDRTQSVRLGTTISSKAIVTSGVPQGSVLGPYLFCLSLADLKPLRTSTLLVKYVDDITLCMPLRKDKRNDHVEEEHQNVLSWSKENHLKINPEKCKTIAFTKSQIYEPVTLTHVASVESIKLLGVIINARLNWKSHIRNVCSIATRRMYALRILKKSTSLSKSDLITVYNAIIRSILEYASPAFGRLPTSLANKLERVQARCHRIICSPSPRTSCRCGSFPDLRSRRQSAMLKLLNQTYLPNHILNTISPRRSKRTNRLILPHTTTTRFLSSFIPHATYLMNFL